MTAFHMMSSRQICLGWRGWSEGWPLRDSEEAFTILSQVSWTAKVSLAICCLVWHVWARTLIHSPLVCSAPLVAAVSALSLAAFSYEENESI